MDRLAFELATCLYRNLTPHLTDFSIFRPITVPLGAFDALAALGRSLAADVTAPIVGEHWRACTFIPTADAEDSIRSRAAVVW